MMTTAMVLGLLNIAGKKNLERIRASFFPQQYDDDYDALKFVEHCMGNQLTRVRSFTYSNNMMTITMLTLVESCMEKNSLK